MHRGSLTTLLVVLLATSLPAISCASEGAVGRARDPVQLYAEAEALMEAGAYAGACARLDQAASMLRTGLPDSKLQLVRTLSKLARAQLKDGRHDDVLKSVAEVVESGEDQGPEFVTLVAEARISRLMAHLRRAERSEAAAEGQAVIDFLEREGQSESSQAATAWQLRGTALIEQGDYINARPSLEKALELAIVADGPVSLQAAEATHELGYMYMKLGDAYTARKHLEDSLSMKIAAVGEDDLANARTLVVLGIVYRDMGEYEAAIRVLKRSQRIYDAALGEGSAFSAFSLNNMGSVYRRMGEYEAAITAIRRSIDIRRKLLRPTHPRLAASINNLANVYFDLGEKDEQYALKIEALRLFEEEFGPAHPDVAIACHNLAIWHENYGSAEAAHEYYDRALTIRRALYGDQHRLTGSTLYNIAKLYSRQGDYARAREKLEESLEIHLNVLGPDHPVTIMNKLELAEVERLTGNPERSRELLTDAEKSATGNVVTKPMQVSLFKRLADYHASQGYPSLAALYGKRAVNVMQSMRAAASGVEQRLQSSFVDAWAAVYRDLADLLITEGRLMEAQQVLSMLKEEEFFQYMRGRSSGEAGLDTRATFTTSEIPWAQRYDEINGRIAAIGEELADLRYRQRARQRLGEDLDAKELERVAALESDMEVSRRAFNHYLSELRDYFASQAGERAIEFGEKGLDELRVLQGVLGRIEDATDERAVLLTYLVTEDRVRILLTTPNSQLTRDSSITAAALNRKIFALREQLQSPHSAPRAAARYLYDVLLAPVAGDLELVEAKILLVSLDEQLRYIPYAALYDGRKYIAQRYSIGVFTPAARYTLERSPQQTWRAAGLGVSNPPAEFTPLPSVVIELDRIVREAGNEARRADAGVLDGKVWLDEAFTSDALSDALDEGYPVIHVASHFVFKPGTESDSYLLLGDGSRLTLDEFVSGGYAFDGVDLLTLSACETALGGTSANGREIEGFGALAQKQGAGAVVATLWPVADASTAEFMARFYDYRQKDGLSKGQALRAAQLDFIRGEPSALSAVVRARGLVADALGDSPEGDNPPATDLSHPFYWAPFIIMGNWQ